jgi:hypothetical protein
MGVEGRRSIRILTRLERQPGGRPSLDGQNPGTLFAKPEISGWNRANREPSVRTQNSVLRSNVQFDEPEGSIVQIFGLQAAGWIGATHVCLLVDREGQAPG